MTTIQITASDVTRPTTTPVTSTVLDHAAVTDSGDDFAKRNDAGLWSSYNCVDTLTPTPMCPDPSLTETGQFKQFSSAPWMPGFTFAVQAGVQCAAVGLDTDDQKSEILRVFNANEGKGIEQGLLYNRFVASDEDHVDDMGQSVSWDAPVDVTPTADVSLVTALALLEGYAASNYAGLPTIHMPRAAATILEAHGLIEWRGTKAFTKNGSKVAMGGGYDPETIGTGDWDGTFDLYATGEIYVERSETVDIQSWTLHVGRPANEETGDPGLPNNTVIALVERMYRVAIDCLAAKATGKVI